MQVLHLSYERYGARLCWVPCVEDPGRDVRKFVSGVTEDEKASIRSYWETQFPPPEVALSDIESKTLYTETINRSSDFDGVKEKYTKPVSIPDGFQLASYEKEILHKKGTPNVDIVNAPMTGAKGDVSFEIHIGLDAFYKEAVRVRIKVVAEPTPENKASYDNALRAWREEQIQKSIADLSKKKMEEVSGMINTPWPPSELMRRIIIDYFGQTPIDYGMMHRFETLFEWENLSYELHAPWSKPIDVNGLQSLQVGFDNASYATVYVPIRPGYEALAVSYLISLGAWFRPATTSLNGECHSVCCSRFYNESLPKVRKYPRI
jgi:hypothetical protein